MHLHYCISEFFENKDFDMSVNKLQVTVFEPAT